MFRNTEEDPDLVLANILPLLLLPQEIQLQIIGYLSSRDLININQTCAHLHTISSDKSLLSLWSAGATAKSYHAFLSDQCQTLLNRHDDLFFVEFFYLAKDDFFQNKAARFERKYKPPLNLQIVKVNELNSDAFDCNSIDACIINCDNNYRPDSPFNFVVNHLRKTFKENPKQFPLVILASEKAGPSLFPVKLSFPYLCVQYKTTNDHHIVIDDFYKKIRERMKAMAAKIDIKQAIKPSQNCCLTM